MDINLATNSELEEELNRLKTQFEKAKIDFAKAYQEMEECSKQYLEAEAILNKRLGKNS